MRSERNTNDGAKRAASQPGPASDEARASYRSPSPAGAAAPRKIQRAGSPRRSLGLAGALAGAMLLTAGCVTSPVTGRSSFNYFSESQDIELGRDAFQQILSESDVVQSGPQLEMVRRIMNRLVAVAEDPGYEWEVQLIRDDQQANAFALPGGKMAVYTGILPITQSEAGLAVVMGHEIGHVVARHGTSRVSSSSLADGALEYLGGALNSKEIQAFAGQVAGLLLLPYSRGDESDADHTGLIYMARAGYDPREAIAFWQRMDAMTGGGGTPELLSTHPSHETRIQRLQDLLPEALAIYERP